LSTKTHATVDAQGSQLWPGNKQFPDVTILCIAGRDESVYIKLSEHAVQCAGITKEYFSYPACKFRAKSLTEYDWVVRDGAGLPEDADFIRENRTAAQRFIQPRAGDKGSIDQICLDSINGAIMRSGKGDTLEIGFE